MPCHSLDVFVRDPKRLVVEVLYLSLVSDFAQELKELQQPEQQEESKTDRNERMQPRRKETEEEERLISAAAWEIGGRASGPTCSAQ